MVSPWEPPIRPTRAGGSECFSRARPLILKEILPPRPFFLDTGSAIP